MAYANQKFCWHGVISTDVEKAQAFYTEVLPWKAQTMQMGDMESTMLLAADIPRAHLMAPPMEGVPSHIENYLRVTDVDAATEAATANGGAMLVPPTDIPPGRFSVVTSPSGAALSLFHESDEATAENTPAGPGSFHWIELHSHDLDADVAWMKATFGFTTETMDMPDGGTYYLLNGESGMAGGAMKAMSAEAPSMWLAWIEVADVDACVDRVNNNGGKILAPLMDMPGIGRMAIAMEPTGGVFGVITPAAKD